MFCCVLKAVLTSLIAPELDPSSRYHPPRHLTNHPMKLSGNTVLITGGSEGIGLALAKGFAARESRVLVCGRTEEKLRQAQQGVPGLSYLVADVTDAADRQRLLDWIETEHPEINVLVNNAGIQRRAQLTDGAGAADTGEIAVNLEAPIRLTTLLLPHLLGQAEQGRQAAVINVTSGLGYVALAATPVYGATKAGLQAFTRALRHQLRGTGVEVVDLAPPAVDTKLLEGAQGPDGGGGPPAVTPEQFAKDALRALEKGRSEIRAGGAKLLYVLGRLSPRLSPAQSTCRLGVWDPYVASPIAAERALQAGTSAWGRHGSWLDVSIAVGPDLLTRPPKPNVHVRAVAPRSPW